MNRRKFLAQSALAVLILGGCDKQGKSGGETAGSGMKCGAGKCGANMFDGNLALSKKKKNILNQMREDDPRKECVLQSRSTKDLYDCVRHPKTQKLTQKCGVDKCGSTMEKSKSSSMKCGANKCGSDMKKEKTKPKKVEMKCGAGKCGSKM